MKIFITGGAGFIGSHMAEHFAKKDNDVVIYDNLSRAKLLNKNNKNAEFNWNYLKQYSNITRIKGDIKNFEFLLTSMSGCEVVIHTAAQTAVTTSVTDPRTDFHTNALGTFNVLEAARQNKIKTVLFTSTNKVYGHNVNNVLLTENEERYDFKDRKGISEDFSIDLCEHTPYGCSKLTGDIYMQDYARLYGIRTAVFRMSCIYGTRQFGFEDQGWVSWFIIAALTGKPLTIYGDGKQVRDVLYITDLVNLFEKFIESDLQHGVFNIGGGPDNVLSLLKLLKILEIELGRKIPVSFADWRPSDQKVYISNISKAQKELNWSPKVEPEQGVKNLINWVKENIDRFK